MESFCDKGVDCLLGAALIPPANANTERQACLDAAAGALDCNRAVDVTESYNQCLADIEATACETVIAGIQNGTSTLPQTCTGVILIR
jgi:hypothetical protein